MARLTLTKPQRKVLSKAVSSLSLAIDTGDYGLIWDILEVMGDMLASMGLAERRKIKAKKLRGSLTNKAFKDITEALKGGKDG